MNRHVCPDAVDIGTTEIMTSYNDIMGRLLKGPTMVAVVFLLGGIITRPGGAQDRPNIIVIITDDQGYGDLGFTGNPVIRTPHLDAMGARSARIETFYVSPVCAPTRASLMTGRYNYRTGVVDTWLGRAMMRSDEETIAEILKNAGYSTGIFGKWHLGDTYPMRPIDQGFDEALVHRGGGIGQPSDPSGGEGAYTDPILFHNGETAPRKGYVTDVVFDAAMTWVEAEHDREQPFFAYIATNAPHGPFHDVPEEEYAYYKAQDLGEDSDADRLARIYAMITNIDDNVGRLFDHMDGLGLTENTMVVFLMDNGPNTRRYVADMRGMKGEVYEGGIRSPLFVHWPGRLEQGTASDRIAAHIDILPTLLDAAGISTDPDRELDGRSLRPLLERRDVDWPDRMIAIQSHRGDEPIRYHQFAIRSQRWKLLNNSGFHNNELPPGPPAFELYDMEGDPGETTNVADRHPAVMEQMRAAYDDWFDDVGSTRLTTYAPLRTHIGTPHEDPVVLTRQDWRYEGESGGWDRDAEGYWLLHVANGGPYDLRIRFEPEESAGILQVRAGSEVYSQPLAAGASSATFTEMRLPEGDLRLEARLSHSDKSRGVHQIDVIRTER